MKYGRIPYVDIPASRVAQGCMMLQEDKCEEAFKLLDAVYEAGVTLFDSAHGYGGGACDRVFGKWVRNRGLRDKVILLDKGCHHDGAVNRVTPQCITSDLNDCLKNTGFDMIDIFAFHRDDDTQPVGPLVERLNQHASEGKIRAFGASNWSHRRIAEANAYAQANGLMPMAVSSPHYSLAQCIDDPWGRGSVTITGTGRQAARDWYKANQMPLLPWSSLCGGFFSGRYRRDNVHSLAGWADEHTARCYFSEFNFRRLERAGELAKEKGATPARVALAWMLCGPLNCFPLTAAHNPDEARDNAAAADLTLTPAEIAWLNLETQSR
ncbi:MAG TPA: aldo/keto reductase [Phycisphaerae bacterium]|nr:aldo/keto reductase [Phycisphaerae bacterium]